MSYETDRRKIVKKYYWRSETGKTLFIGQLLKTGVCEKMVRQSEHQLTEPPAWAIDRDMFEDLVSRGCKGFYLKDRETGCYWTVSMDAFLRAKYIPVERAGYGPQYACPLKYWRVNGKAAEQSVLL